MLSLSRDGLFLGAARTVLDIFDEKERSGDFSTRFTLNSRNVQRFPFRMENVRNCPKSTNIHEITLLADDDHGGTKYPRNTSFIQPLLHSSIVYHYLIHSFTMVSD
jgi:hypothetical protein